MLLERKTLFPGVQYRPMTTEALRDFVHDAQRLGFTPFRKRRLLEAVAPFCCGVALKYCLKYNINDIQEFSAASWLAIENAVNGFDEKCKNGFLVYLAFHLQASYNKMVYGVFTKFRYYGDDHAVDLVSLDKTIEGPDGGGIALLETIPDFSTVEELANASDARNIERIFSKTELKPKETKILLEYFGLNDIEYNLRDLGEKYGFSRECARHKIKNALNKIQNKLGVTEKRSKTHKHKEKTP